MSKSDGTDGGSENDKLVEELNEIANFYKDFADTLSENLKKAGKLSKSCRDCGNDMMYHEEQGFYCPVCDHE